MDMSHSDNLKIGAIILCRMDSSRLPGKVLFKLKSKPMLEHIIDRLLKVNALTDSCIVATTSREVDKCIVDFIKQNKQSSIFRGEADNVANRVIECAKEYNLDYFFRINADSPFIEPQLLEQACNIAYKKKYDFITNLYPRSFPYGVSIELIKTSFYQSIYSEIAAEYEQEHVTAYLYKNMSNINYYNIKKEGENWSQVRLVVDDEGDYLKLSKLVNALPKEFCDITYQEAINNIKENGVF